MIKIKHRMNTIEELKKTPQELGVEIDIRSLGSKLILQHEPYIKGQVIEEWLDLYKHKILILNVKEEGLEKKLIKLMEEYSISDYFFLDQSFPFLVKTAKEGERRSAVRVSEYENIQNAMKLSGMIDWVWLDCFSKFPVNNQEVDILRDKGNFKICLVSPELQNKTREDTIIYRKNIKAKGIKVDAVCTKYPELWD
jgi:hypothetical protein